MDIVEPVYPNQALPVNSDNTTMLPPPPSSPQSRMRKWLFLIPVIALIGIVIFLVKTFILPSSTELSVRNLMRMSCEDTGEITDCTAKVTVTNNKQEYKQGNALMAGKHFSWVGNFNKGESLLIFWEGEYPDCADVVTIPLGVANGDLDKCIYKDEVVNRANKFNPTGYLIQRSETTELAPGYSFTLNVPAGYVGSTRKDNGRIAEITYENSKGSKLQIGFSNQNTLSSNKHESNITVGGIDFAQSFEPTTVNNKTITTWLPLNQQSLARFAGMSAKITDFADAEAFALFSSITFSNAFVDLLKTGLGPEAIQFTNPSIAIQNISYKSIYTELNQTIGTINAYEVSLLVKSDASQPIFAMYEIVGDNINQVSTETVISDKIKALPQYATLNNPDIHKKIIEYVRAIIPEELLSNAQYILLSTDGLYDNIAWVGRTNDQYGLTFNIDLLDFAKELRSPQEKYIDTLSHEAIHLLQYSETDKQIDKENCQTFYISDWGCSITSSYMANFYAKFWSDRYPDFTTDHPEDKKWQEWTQFYDKYPHQFVSVYAASDPVEDFAETFRTYVWDFNPKTEYKDLIGKKYAYFESTQGLKRLKEAFIKRQSSDSYVQTDNSGTETLSQTWADGIIKKYQIPIYPGSTFSEAEYFPECTDKITEGSCENNRIVYKTGDSAKQVAQWYFNLAKDGDWIFSGDTPEKATDSYANIISKKYMETFLLHVYEPGKISGDGSGSEIVFDSMPTK